MSGHSQIHSAKEKNFVSRWRNKKQCRKAVRHCGCDAPLRPTVKSPLTHMSTRGVGHPSAHIQRLSSPVASHNYDVAPPSCSSKSATSKSYKRESHQLCLIKRRAFLIVHQGPSLGYVFRLRLRDWQIIPFAQVVFFLFCFLMLFE